MARREHQGLQDQRGQRREDHDKLGYLYSEINRGRNEAAGDYEDAPPSGEEDEEEPDEDPEPNE